MSTKADAIGVGAEPIAQEPDLALVERDQDRLVGGDAITDERQGPCKEVVRTLIEERFVSELPVAGRRGPILHDR